MVDRDESRVRHLRDQKYDAYQRDLTSPDLLTGLPVFEIAFVMTGDPDANLTAVLTIKKRYPSVQIVARAIDPVSGQKLTASRGRFCPLPAGGGRPLRRPPDPEAALEPDFPAALHHARRLGGDVRDHHPQEPGSRCHLLCHGPRGDRKARKPQNPHSPDLLRGQHRPPGEPDLRQPARYQDGAPDPRGVSACTYLAIVDCSAPGANNDIPPQTKINVVIDHHKEGRHVASQGMFVDIRPGVGATASIMTQYLQELDVPVDKRVATALLYGIRTDTKEFTRNVTPQDLNYAGFLLPLTDADLLDKIMSPSMSQETLDVIGKAIHERKVQSGYLFANVGYVMNRDALPQAADLLITLEGVNTALVYGITDNAIVISARNRDIRLHIGNALSEAFGEMGDAGGHPNMAAATLPLHYFGRVENKAQLLEIVMSLSSRSSRTSWGWRTRAKRMGPESRQFVPCPRTPARDPGAGMEAGGEFHAIR